MAPGSAKASIASHSSSENGTAQLFRHNYQRYQVEIESHNALLF